MSTFMKGSKGGYSDETQKDINYSEDKKPSLEIGEKDLKEMVRLFVHVETVVDLREYYQYGTETEVKKEKLKLLQQKAKEFVAKVSTILEEKGKL